MSAMSIGTRSGYPLEMTLEKTEAAIEFSRRCVDNSKAIECDCLITVNDEFKDLSIKAYRVYVDMVADLAHYGHQNVIVQAIKEGKKWAQDAKVFLIVGVHSDEDCTPYKRKPIYDLAERVATIAGFRNVDAVYIPAPLHITQDLIEKLKIDRIVHGDDLTEEKKQCMYGVPIKMGIMSFVPYTKGVSTTDLIKRIRDGETAPTAV